MSTETRNSKSQEATGKGFTDSNQATAERLALKEKKKRKEKHLFFFFKYRYNIPRYLYEHFPIATQ